MKRHERLIPLTHDHHHALAQARHLRMGAEAELDERIAALRRFVDFYESDALLHFREEEEMVFPLVVDRPEAEPGLTRLMMEHLRMHALVRVLRGQADCPAAGTMNELATMLEGHIRFEEKTLFPLVERLAASELGDVELAPRNRIQPDRFVTL